MTKAFSKKTFLILALLGSFSCFADPTYILCRNKKSVRTVRVQESDEGPCSTLYTKFGAEQTVASSRSTAACMMVLKNIRTNLEKAAWTCKDISRSKISSDDIASQ